MKIINCIIFFLTVVIITGCSSQYYRDEPRRDRNLTDRENYYANYKIILNKVERPQNAEIRYGEFIIDVPTDTTKYKSYFEDSMIKVFFVNSSSNIAFLMENKTDYTIKLIWDEGAYVDENKVSHRIIHSGIKYADKEKSQASSIIAKNSKIEDIVFPSDYVIYDERAIKWSEKPFFKNYGNNFQSPRVVQENENLIHARNLMEFQNKIIDNLNKEYQIVLPLQIEGITNDYIFTFKIIDIESYLEK